MIELGDIYKAIEHEGAKLFVYNIGFSPAATIEESGAYAVFFDPAVCTSVPKLKYCLAHECGHCATGATHRLASRWDIIQRHEYKANRWAIERFLPFADMQTAMDAGYTEPWQLAEYFDVPQEFVLAALEHYTVHKEKSFNAKAGAI